jgi:hypothetical protein
MGLNLAVEESLKVEGVHHTVNEESEGAAKRLHEVVIMGNFWIAIKASALVRIRNISLDAEHTLTAHRVKDRSHKSEEIPVGRSVDSASFHCALEPWTYRLDDGRWIRDQQGKADTATDGEELKRLQQDQHGTTRSHESDEHAQKYSDDSNDYAHDALSSITILLFGRFVGAIT